jgi:hypothetical protein
MTSKSKIETTASERKLELWCHIIAVGSSDRVEEDVDEVVNLPAALL